MPHWDKDKNRIQMEVSVILVTTPKIRKICYGKNSQASLNIERNATESITFSFRRCVIQHQTCSVPLSGAPSCAGRSVRPYE
jgi:hypothetical protein